MGSDEEKVVVLLYRRVKVSGGRAVSELVENDIFHPVVEHFLYYSAVVLLIGVAGDPCP